MDINSDINDNYEFFCKLLQSSKSEHMPIKSVKFNKYKHKKYKWISKGIIKSIVIKDKLYKLMTLHQGWGQVQYLYLVLVLKYIFIST